jgi:two-component system sensor histidine kinase KdpD
VQREAQTALARRAEMESLYSFSRGILLADTATNEPIAEQIARLLVRVFDCPGSAVLDSATGAFYYSGPESLELDAERMRQTILHGIVERESAVQIFPVSLGGQPIGCAAVKGLNLSQPAIDSLANLIAIGLERARSLQSASKAEASRQSEELKSTLLDAIAHEFKTPLTSIKAAASGLLSASMAPSEHELAIIVEEEADRLNVLVSQTIRMSRIEAGKVQLERRMVEPVEVVRSALAQLGSRAGDRQVSIEPAAGLEETSLDPDLFAIAVRQALDNALKYSNLTDPVEVLLSLSPKELLVEVRDHGPGIPAGEQTQVFEKFYRGASQAKQVPGSGMGLSIAREIVELHGGKAWIESQPGHGTSFFASIPRLT